jgi:hypothetical protein
VGEAAAGGRGAGCFVVVVGFAESLTGCLPLPADYDCDQGVLRRSVAAAGGVLKPEVAAVPVRGVCCAAVVPVRLLLAVPEAGCSCRRLRSPSGTRAVAGSGKRPGSGSGTRAPLHEPGEVAS